MADTLAQSLIDALADLTVVEKGRTVDTGSYSYSYADLGEVVKLTRPVLAEHGLVALTPIHDHGAGLACTVTLLHTSGERLDLGPFPFPHGRDAQATGSMVTYHRRYALVAALGMATGEDDDGAGATARQASTDDYVPGLRTSVRAAMSKLNEPQKVALKTWWAENHLPVVGELTGEQAGEVIGFLMSLPDEPVMPDPEEEM